MVAGMSVQSFGTSIQYFTVPSGTIVLRLSHSLLLVYVGKYFYDVHLNNEYYEHKCNQLGC